MRSHKNGHTRNPLALWNAFVKITVAYIPGDPQGVQLENGATKRGINPFIARPPNIQSGITDVCYVGFLANYDIA